MGIERSGTDPNIGVPPADEAAVREIRTEQGQAVITELRRVSAAFSGLFDPTVLIANQQETGASIGSGFRFTPEQIEDQLRQSQRLIDQYKSDHLDIEKITSVAPPSPDQAGSVAHATALAKWGANLLKLNQSDINFLEQWTVTLTQAKRRYMDTEHLTADQWARLAKGLGK